MSRSYRQFLQDWKHLRCDSAGYGLKIYGESAPEFVLDALNLWIAICYDVYLTHQCEASTRHALRPYGDFGRSILKYQEDIGFVADQLKQLDDTVIRHLTEPPYDVTLSFKHLKVESLTVRRVLIFLRPTINAAWTGANPAGPLSSLRTVCLFLSHLNFVTKEQESELIKDWVQVQETLSTVPYQPLDVQARDNIFGRFHLPDRMIGSHGNGAVAHAGVNSIEDKYLDGVFPQRLRYLSLDFPDLTHPFGKDAAVCEESRLKFVPKQLGKYRSICMEPSAMMFAQQGVKAWLYDTIRDDPHLHAHIKLEDDSQNREFARLGSIDGSYATIDLSHASDSVSFELVKGWTYGLPIGKVLRCVRTPKVGMPDGTTYDLVSYATMGAATTFPVECLVFAAICEEVILLQQGFVDRRDYSIYGDDIVVKERFVYRIIDKLKECGFEVNEAKSFWLRSRHIFRESCGGHYVDGQDVSPIRLSRRFRGLRTKVPEQVSGLIDLGNRLLDGYPFTRGVVLDALLRPVKGGSRRRWFFFTDNVLDSASLHSRLPDNHHFAAMVARTPDERRAVKRQRSLSKAYQRSVGMGWTLSMKIDRGTRDEVALYEWLRRAETREPIWKYWKFLPCLSQCDEPVRVGKKLPSSDSWRFY